VKRALPLRKRATAGLFGEDADVPRESLPVFKYLTEARLQTVDPVDISVGRDLVAPATPAAHRVTGHNGSF